MGAMMFEFVVGQNPVDAQCYKLSTETIEYEDVEEKLGEEELSIQMKTFILKCLQQDPEERYSFKEVLDH